MLDLSDTAARLTAALVDVRSESGDEGPLTDLVESAVRGCGQQTSITVRRDGNVVLARTDLGHHRRVILAGHLDTVPIADNLPSRLQGDALHGCGSSDMKSGVAIQLRMAHLIGSGALRPGVDVSWVFYDCEEVEAERNGLRRIAEQQPDELAADLAIVLEGTCGIVEGGCQGTLRAVVTTAGKRAHSARSWLGDNAIHGLAPLLQRLQDYRPRVVDVDGLTYREGLNAVGVSGGVAGNVIPDQARLTVNYRFAPDRTEADAADHVRSVFAGSDVVIVDSAPAARPGLDDPLAQALVAATGGRPEAKLGWTDVARFGALGIPAVNFGPGDANVAHTREEFVLVSRIVAAEAAMAQFLATAGQ